MRGSGQRQLGPIAGDAALPELAAAGGNVAYFFGGGPGSSDTWVLLPAIAGLLGCLGTIEERGRVAGQPYFHLRWRDGGPVPGEPLAGSR